MAKSFKGKKIDMDALYMQNQKTIALGNANMNARGDKLGKNGKIRKTREKQMEEYYLAKPQAITDKFSISADPVSVKVLNKISKKQKQDENKIKGKKKKNIQTDLTDKLKKD